MKIGYNYKTFAKIKICYKNRFTCIIQEFDETELF